MEIGLILNAISNHHYDNNFVNYVSERDASCRDMALHVQGTHRIMSLHGTAHSTCIYIELCGSLETYRYTHYY